MKPVRHIHFGNCFVTASFVGWIHTPYYLFSSSPSSILPSLLSLLSLLSMNRLTGTVCSLFNDRDWGTSSSFCLFTSYLSLCSPIHSRILSTWWCLCKGTILGARKLRFFCADFRNIFCVAIDAQKNHPRIGLSYKFYQSILVSWGAMWSFACSARTRSPLHCSIQYRNGDSMIQLRWY